MVALLLAVALAHPTAAANRALAQRDTLALLQRVALPAGREQLAGAPGGAGGLLGRPFQVPGGELVQRHRLWRVEDPLDSVIAFAGTHAPRGSRRDGSGSAGGLGAPANETLTFSFPANAGRISLRWLSVTMVALPDGSTGVRADAQDIWIVPRPASEVVPAGVSEVDVGAHRVTAAGKVATIVRWFDALPTVQPDSNFSCPALVAGPKIRLAFRGAGGLLAWATFGANTIHHSLVSTPCTPISFSTQGQVEFPELVGGRFFPRVERLLGVKLR